MALSVISQPNSFIQSANNDSIFIISGSSGTSGSIFDEKYIADVFVGGNRVTTLKTFPDPNYGYGVFNLRNITPNFVSYDFIYDLSQDTASIFHTASNSSANIQLSFGKEYSLPGGGFSQSRNEVSSSTFHYINSSLSYTDEVTTNLSASYMVTGATSSIANFLTKADFTIPTYNNLRNHLYFFASSSVNIFCAIFTFDVNNNPLGTYFTHSPYSGIVGTQIIETGFPQLSRLTSGSDDLTGYVVVSGNPVMLNPDVNTYSVILNGDGGAHPFTNTVTYQIKQDRSRFTPYAVKVYWLSTLGGFDSWLFNKSNLKTTTKTQSSFKKIPGQLQSNGTYSLNTYDRAVIPYFTQLDSKIQLSTDFLTDKHVRYLKGLFSSPVVYLEDSNGVLISATVDTSDYTLNQTAVNQKMFSLSLTFIPSVSDYRQSL